jgi:hypothetical protein
MSEYCANKWDKNCEIASRVAGEYTPSIQQPLPNNLLRVDSPAGCLGLTSGEILIRNTAERKYRINIRRSDIKFEPFDPTVANSPMISYEAGYEDATMFPVALYAVDPNTIDKDPVMDKILIKPKIAFHILINIYNTMKRQGTLKNLSGTKLGHFYTVNKDFFEKKIYNQVSL